MLSGCGDKIDKTSRAIDSELDTARFLESDKIFEKAFKSESH